MLTQRVEACSTVERTRNIRLQLTAGLKLIIHTVLPLVNRQSGCGRVYSFSGKQALGAGPRCLPFSPTPDFGGTPPEHATGACPYINGGHHIHPSSLPPERTQP